MSVENKIDPTFLKKGMELKKEIKMDKKLFSISKIGVAIIIILGIVFFTAFFSVSAILFKKYWIKPLAEIDIMGIIVTALGTSTMFTGTLIFPPSVLLGVAIWHIYDKIESKKTTYSLSYEKTCGKI